MITYNEFVQKAEELRDLQREYFKTESASPRKMQLLDKCRAKEAELDKAIKQFKQAVAANAQTGIFSPARLRVQVITDSPVLAAHNLTPGTQADTISCPTQYQAVYADSMWVQSPITMDAVRLKQGEFKLISE